MNRKLFIVAAIAVLSVAGVAGCDRSAAPSDAGSVGVTTPAKPDSKSTAAAPVTAGKENCPSVETAQRVLTKVFPEGDGPSMPTKIECPDGDGMWAIGTTPGVDSVSLFTYAGAYGWEERDVAEEPSVCQSVGPKVRARLTGCPQE